MYLLNKQIQAITLLLLLGMIWGSGYAIARYATLHGVPPLGYAFWQSLGPSLFLLCLCWFLKLPIPLDKQHLRFYFWTGLIGIAIPNSNMYFASPHLPAGLIALLVNTVPLVTYCLSLLIGLERFSLARLLGVLIGFVGIMMIALPNLSLSGSAGYFWILILLITPFCFAICAIYAASFSGTTNNLSLATGMLCAATFLLAPVTLLTQNFYLFNSTFHRQDWLILLEILLSSAGYLLFFQLLKKAGPVYYSLVGGIVMLTGLFWGYLIFDEILNLWTSLAALLIVFGVFIVTFATKYQAGSAH